MDFEVIVTLVGLFGAIAGALIWFGNRCPKCRKFASRRRTGRSKPDAGFFQPAEDEWQCPHCDHRDWRPT